MAQHLEGTSPYPGEHLAVQVPSSEFLEGTFTRRYPASYPPGASAIVARREGVAGEEIQAVLFDKAAFTPEKAVGWLKGKGMKAVVEPAAADAPVVAPSWR